MVSRTKRTVPGRDRVGRSRGRQGQSTQRRILALEAPFHKPRFDSDALRQRGILLYRTMSFAHARTLWQSDSYDLVTIDTSLGEKSVLEFCREVKERSPGQQIALITDNVAEWSDAPYVDAVIPRKKAKVANQADALLRIA